MTLKIIGIGIGAVILCAGLYFLIKERQDKESRKIYGVISGAGALVLAGCLIAAILA